MSLSRRDWLKTMGAVGVGALAPLEQRAASSEPIVRVATRYAPGDIVELYSTSDVFMPAARPDVDEVQLRLSRARASSSAIIASASSSSPTRTRTGSIARACRDGQRRRAGVTCDRLRLGRRTGDVEGKLTAHSRDAAGSSSGT